MPFLIPSKTFLIGEYGVLQEGGALLLNTLPYFQFQDGHFLDPYQQNQNDKTQKASKVGGFGASSAKWLCQYLSGNHLSEYEKTCLFHHNLSAKLASKIKNQYQKDMSQGGIAPSGVDVLSQCLGGMCYIDIPKNTFKILPFKEFFKGLSFVICTTGHKILTHQHLKENINLQACQLLAQKSQKAIKALLQKNIPEFLKALEAFAQCLEEKGFCCQNTQKLKQHIKKYFPKVVVKGCGAMGMDTLLIVCQSRMLPDIKTLVKKDILAKQTGGRLITNDDLKSSFYNPLWLP